MRQRFEVRSGNIPEYPGLATRLCCRKSKAEITKIGCGLCRLALHQLEYRLVQTNASRATVFGRLRTGLWFRFQPAPFERPQISGMNPVCTYQFLYVAVLREKRHWGNCTIGQNTLQILSQRKAGVLNFYSGFCVAVFGLLHKLLDRRLHSPQNKRGTWQTHHFEGAHSLMQLLTCDAQLAGIKGCQIRAACRLGISDKTFERLGGAIQ